MKIKHIHGSNNVSCGPNDLILNCVLRNGEFYINTFIKHYRNLGVKHFIFLDNCSTDRSLELLCKHENITVLQTSAPYKLYQNTMKRYLAEEFCKKRWDLYVDIDEFFDYPYSNILSLDDFLLYLNENRYTAVVTQLLDLFSEKPLLHSLEGEFSEVNFQYYDLSGIWKHNYEFTKYPLEKIKFHRGGIRKLLFGTDNGLTKISLMLIDGKLKSFVGYHHTRNARIADISCVLKHYPFIPSFYEKVKDAVLTKRHGIYTSEYSAYWEKLKSIPNLNFMFETSQRFKGLEKLIEQKFLIVTKEYLDWVSVHNRKIKTA